MPSKLPDPDSPARSLSGSIWDMPLKNPKNPVKPIQNSFTFRPETKTAPLQLTSIKPLSFHPLPVDHGNLPSTGKRFYGWSKRGVSMIRKSGFVFSRVIFLLSVFLIGLLACGGASVRWRNFRRRIVCRRSSRRRAYGRQFFGRHDRFRWFLWDRGGWLRQCLGRKF